MLKIWNREETLTLPNGETRTPKQLMADKNYGFTKVGTVVLDQIDGVTYGIDSLGVLKQVYGISEDLTVDEALAAIKAARDAQNAPAPVVSSEAEELLNILLGGTGHD